MSFFLKWVLWNFPNTFNQPKILKVCLENLFCHLLFHISIKFQPAGVEPYFTKLDSLNCFSRAGLLQHRPDMLPFGITKYFVRFTRFWHCGYFRRICAICCSNMFDYFFPPWNFLFDFLYQIKHTQKQIPGKSWSLSLLWMIFLFSWNSL